MSLKPTLAELRKAFLARQIEDRERKRIAGADAWRANQIRPKGRRNWKFHKEAGTPIEIPSWVHDPRNNELLAHEEKTGPDQKLAPGCFGMATAFREDATECMPCPFRQRCKPVCAANLIVLNAEMPLNAELLTELIERKAYDLTRNHKAKAKSRAKLKAARPNEYLVPSPALTRETMKIRLAELTRWLADDKPRQRQYRKHEGEILRDYIVAQSERKRTNVKLGPTAFASALSKQTGTTITTASAQKRLKRLKLLESAAGPWFISERLSLP
jgi:hypothetical protein